MVPSSFTSALSALIRDVISRASYWRINSESMLSTKPSSLTSPSGLGGVGVLVGVSVAGGGVGLRMGGLVH